MDERAQDLDRRPSDDGGCAQSVRPRFLDPLPRAAGGGAGGVVVEVVLGPVPERRAAEPAPVAAAADLSPVATTPDAQEQAAVGPPDAAPSTEMLTAIEPRVADFPAPTEVDDGASPDPAPPSAVDPAADAPEPALGWGSAPLTADATIESAAPIAPRDAPPGQPMPAVPVEIDATASDEAPVPATSEPAPSPEPLPPPQAYDAEALVPRTAPDPAAEPSPVEERAAAFPPEPVDTLSLPHAVAPETPPPPALPAASDSHPPLLAQIPTVVFSRDRPVPLPPSVREELATAALPSPAEPEPDAAPPTVADPPAPAPVDNVVRLRPRPAAPERERRLPPIPPPVVYAPRQPELPPSPAPARVWQREERARRSWLRLALLAAGGMLAALAALLVTLVVLYRWVDPPASTLMLGQYFTGTSINRQWMPLERISPSLVAAVIVSEDGQFCRHRGVDWGELREVLETAGDGSPRGGSTITMQVVKNLFLWPSRSYVRKAVEIPLALGVEALWSKRRILEIYLNIAEWGPGVFGAEAAARHHFRKSALALSPREAALLAVALPNPFDRRAGRPGPGTQRLADSLLLRLRLANATCLRPPP